MAKSKISKGKSLTKLRKEARAKKLPPKTVVGRQNKSLKKNKPGSKYKYPKAKK